MSVKSQRRKNTTTSNKEKSKPTSKQKTKENKQTNKQTDRQTDKQTYKHTKNTNQQTNQPTNNQQPQQQQQEKNKRNGYLELSTILHESKPTKWNLQLKRNLPSKTLPALCLRGIDTFAHVHRDTCVSQRRQPATK